MSLRQVVLGGLLGLCMVLMNGQARAADSKFSGLMFGDYYLVGSGANKKQNAFEIQRIYLQYDLKWNDEFSGRARLEMNDAGFGKNGKMVPFVKHAFLQYKKNGKALIAGLSATPTFDVSEGIWGYRSVEKTIMDLDHIATSADAGVAFKGQLDEAGKVGAWVMLANGTGQASEGDNDKKIYGHLHFKPGTLDATVYGDWDSGSHNYTVAGFVGKGGKPFHGGLEGFMQVKKNAGSAKAYGISAFGAEQVNEKTEVFGRVDFFEPNNKTANDRTYLIIGGFDVSPAKDVHIIPNVEATAYQDSSVKTKVMPRLTLYVKF